MDAYVPIRVGDRFAGSHKMYANGEAKLSERGYRLVMQRGHPRARRGWVFEHILVAEKALGRYLPRSATIHHVNGDQLDNRPSNLVICDSQAYHLRLHRRQRAYDATGNANLLWCHYCQSFDVPERLNRDQTHHLKCAADWQERHRQAKRGALC